MQDTALISKTCGRCFLQELLEWRKQWSSSQYLLLLKQNTIASYMSAMQRINLQHNKAERKFMPKYGELRMIEQFFKERNFCFCAALDGSNGRKMVDKNVLKQFPHSQKALSMSIVVGDKNQPNKQNPHKLGRSRGGNFIACITFKVRHALEPDMKKLYTHQFIVKILI